MNINVLIDSVVRQTVVLIAQLATTSGTRAPLAHVAGQVFLNLSHELKNHGVGNKVIADMFGLALRTYRDRVRRLSASATEQGATLWDAVRNYVVEHGTVSRTAILQRFRADDPLSVRGVLNDLTESGILFRAGRGKATTYRATSSEELAIALPSSSESALEEIAWVTLHQQGPLAAAELATLLNLEEAVVQGVLERLVEQQRASLQEGLYIVRHFVIPLNATRGWEAALLDHYQAVVRTMVGKLRGGQHRAQLDSVTGGSTYHFDLYPGHPLEQELLQLLGSVRERVSALREAARQHTPPDPESAYRLVFYAGQDVIGLAKPSKKREQS